MAYNVLQKTAGLKMVPVYIPDAPGYSPGSTPFPKNNNYSFPPISYDIEQDMYEMGGKYFETYESLNGYMMSTLWMQQEGHLGYGYEQGFVAVGMEQANDTEFVQNTVDLTDSGVNPYLAATQSGQVVTRLSTSTYTGVQPVTRLSTSTYTGVQPVTRLSYSTYTGVKPVTYGAPAVKYSPPTGSGIDMSNTGDRLSSYVETQFNKSSLFTL